MTGFDRLPDSAADVFGEGAVAAEAYGLLTVDVPAASWIAALTVARDGLGCTFFDWLSAVDEPGTGFRVCAHVAALGTGGPAGAGVRRLLVRTTVPHAAAALPTATGVYPGAAWHERETHEMFGVDFPGHPHLAPLLLPDEFEGHPLRKDFVLAARVAKAWPGAKEPGESHDGGGPKRRQMLPPGVPDPNEWGPLKGQLPPIPARPARAAAGDRPPRRARTTADATPGAAGTPEAPPRRARRASDGSASQAAPAAQPDAAAPARRRTPDAPWEQPAPDPAPSGTEPPTEGGPSAGPAKPAAEAEPAAGGQRADGERAAGAKPAGGGAPAETSAGGAKPVAGGQRADGESVAEPTAEAEPTAGGAPAETSAGGAEPAADEAPTETPAGGDAA